MVVHDNINHNSNKGAANDPVRLSLGIFGILLGITAVSGLVLSGTCTHADDTTQSDNVTVTVSSACTLSRSAGSGTYSASLNPGQETGDISGSTIKAICNDGNGYSLYAIGYSGDSYTGNNTKMIGTYGNINTGTSGSDSWWAMKLAPVAGTYAPTIVNSFDSYHVVPATFTQVAKLTSATDAGESANGSSVDAYYKVKASTSQVAGTYTGKVKYVLVHPNANVAGTYTIAYNANGGSGTMASQTAYNFDEVTLNTMSGITAPSGYKFAGWCDVQDPNATSSNPQTTCTGTSYADAGTVPPNVANANSTYNLYAMWKESASFNKAFADAGKTQSGGYYKLQDMSSSICSAVDTDEIGQLIDTRDNEVYYVGKLKDNKCWMLDNLRLNPATATLNTSNTNMNASVTPTYTNTTSSFNSYTAAQFNANYKDNTTTSYGSGSGKVGVYYNFCAASAGTICTDSNTSNASYDICPAGWRMPTGGSSGEYQALYTVYSSNATNFRNALSTPLSGYFYNSSQSNLGSYGYFWSSTRSNNTRMYHLRVDSSGVYPQGIYTRYYGISIRCVAK